VSRPVLQPATRLNLTGVRSAADWAQRVEYWQREEDLRRMVEGEGVPWDAFLRAREAREAPRRRLDRVNEMLHLAYKYGVWPEPRRRLRAVGIDVDHARGPKLVRTFPAQLTRR